MHSQTIIVSLSSSNTTSKLLETKKLPIFKPFQISQASQKELRNEKDEFLQAIQNQITSLDLSSSKNPLIEDTLAPLNRRRSSTDPQTSASNNPLISNTPDQSKINVFLDIPKNPISQTESEQEIARLRWNHQPTSSRALIPRDMDLAPPKLV